ncbi:MAG: metallophosphoesterase [Gemmataceae bacterium]
MPPLVLLILLAVLTADAVCWWRADRRARTWPRAAAWRGVVALFLGGQISLVFWVIGGRIEPNAGVGRPPQFLAAVAFLWHLLILPTIAVVAAVAAAARSVARAVPRPAPPAGAGEPTRREFHGMLTTAAPALLAGAGTVVSRDQVQGFRVREVSVALPALPPELDGVRVAVVSDLHVGTFTTGETVRRVVEETSRLDADLILLPGDLIDSALADLGAALDAVSNMQSRHGAYLCLGNHDLIQDGVEFVRRTRARVPLLVGESRTVTVRGVPVQLLGLPWDRDERRSAEAVRQLAGTVAAGAFPILLAHHPHAFDAAAEAGLPLTVSGHTHGGQLMAGESVGFGPVMFRYWSGLYRKPGGNALVVSNGVGNWFPLRVRAPAEVVHLTLRAARA